MSDVKFTREEYEALVSMTGTIDALADVFHGGGSPEALRMTVATIRSVADVIEQLADRIEAA